MWHGLKWCSSSNSLSRAVSPMSAGAFLTLLSMPKASKLATAPSCKIQMQSATSSISQMSAPAGSCAHKQKMLAEFSADTGQQVFAWPNTRWGNFLLERPLLLDFSFFIESNRSLRCHCIVTMPEVMRKHSTAWKGITLMNASLHSSVTSVRGLLKHIAHGSRAYMG